jgi:hypothetical protein
MHIAARARRLASEQDIGGVKRDVGCSSNALGRVSVSSPIRRNRDGSRYPVKNPLICRRKRGRPTCPAALPPVHLGRNDEMRKLIAGAIELHLSGMREDGGSRRLTARNSDRRLASGSADEPTRLGSRVVGLFGRFPIRTRSEFNRASRRPRRRIALRARARNPLTRLAPHRERIRAGNGGRDGWT